MSKSCAGTHILYALAALHHLDRKKMLLSSQARSQVKAFLARIARGLERSQTSEGTWRSDWFNHLEKSSISQSAWSAEKRVSETLVTGHHIEWLLLVDADIRPDSETYIKACRWLQLQLLTNSQASIQLHFCPYSHAAKVLRDVTYSHESPSPLLQKSSRQGKGSQLNNHGINPKSIGTTGLGAPLINLQSVTF